MRAAASGEDAALAVWQGFLSDGLADYATERDRPDHAGTTRISPYLRWGAIHPRTMLADLAGQRSEGAQALRSELCWREFHADVLWNRPETARRNYDQRFDGMRYDTGKTAREMFALWCEGRTGYPIVDAGMRQLLAEGWMHNRVRMIVASFLVKDLHLPWWWGARHFMKHLVDGDLASNQLNWQWVAGSGTDAAPYFRIFNPTTQGQKFDPQGDYVRRYVPELRGVEGKAVHVLKERPEEYPEPIVDHAEERQVALQRYGAITGLSVVCLLVAFRQGQVALPFLDDRPESRALQWVAGRAVPSVFERGAGDLDAELLLGQFGELVVDRHLAPTSVSVERLSLSDGSFGAVLAVNALGMWPDPVARLRELARWVRPGGRVAVVSQPRLPDVTSAAAAEELTGLLTEAGFAQLHMETLDLDLPVVCVLGWLP